MGNWLGEFKDAKTGGSIAFIMHVTNVSTYKIGTSYKMSGYLDFYPNKISGTKETFTSAQCKVGPYGDYIVVESKSPNPIFVNFSGYLNTPWFNAVGSFGKYHDHIYGTLSSSN